MIASPTATVTFVSELSAPLSVWVTFTMSLGANWSGVVLLFNPLVNWTVHLPSEPTRTLLDTVWPATVTLIVAPAVPVPDKVLSVDNTWFPLVVGVTVGAATGIVAWIVPLLLGITKLSTIWLVLVFTNASVTFSGSVPILSFL